MYATLTAVTMVFSLLWSRSDLKMVAGRLKGSLVIKLLKQVLSEVERKKSSIKSQLWSKCCISYFRQREFCRVPSSTQVNWELDIKDEKQRDICPLAWGTDQNTAWEGSWEVNPSCSLQTALKMAFVCQRISFTNPKLMGHCSSEKIPIEMGNGSCFCFLHIKLFSETFKWPSHGYWTFHHLPTFKCTNGCPKGLPHMAKWISSLHSTSLKHWERSRIMWVNIRYI